MGEKGKREVARSKLDVCKGGMDQKPYRKKSTENHWR